MRLAVLSDIHGNLEAFQAVLADLAAKEVERTALLGDVVGYGPDPEECVRLVRERGFACVMGNHELALSDKLRPAWFNPVARRSLEQTREMLGEQSLAWLATLPLYLVIGPCRLVHGAPPASPTIYYFELGRPEIVKRMDRIDEPLCLVGHTHTLGLTSIGPEGEVEHLPLGQGRRTLEPDRRYLVNAGAVGQPRDGDRRAKYVIVDSQAGELEVRYVEYDVETTVNKILERGLPEFNARRLQ